MARGRPCLSARLPERSRGPAARDGQEDETWARVPALHRAHWIAATQKSDSLLGTFVMIVNVQRGASNLGQFERMNAMEFDSGAGKRYYDTTKLETAGR